MDAFRSEVCTTFCSYFTANPNIFIGNTGVSVEQDFSRKPIPFCINDDLNQDTFERNYSFTVKEDNLIMVYNNKKTALVRYYEARLLKVGFNHSKNENKQKLKEDIAKLFNLFQVELNNLRREFDCESNTLFDEFFMENYSLSDTLNTIDKYFTVDERIFLDDSCT